MQMTKNKKKTIAILITLILVSSMAISLCYTKSYAAYDNATATAIAQGMKWDFPAAANYNASATRLLLWNRWQDNVLTNVYGVCAPNPIGVGQELWNWDCSISSGSLLLLDRCVITRLQLQSLTERQRHFLQLGERGITLKPVQNGEFVSDATDRDGPRIRLTKSATHTFVVNFMAQYPTPLCNSRAERLVWCYFKSSHISRDHTCRSARTSNFWVAGLLLLCQPSTGHDQSKDRTPNGTESRRTGTTTRMRLLMEEVVTNISRMASAPNSGHILWTKPTEDGGVVGGNFSKVPGDVFNAGHQYQTRFTNQIVMDGRLYYEQSNYFAATPGDYVCVDLLTGQEIWRNRTMSAIPSFGYQYDWDDMNQHGIVKPGWLFSSNYGTQIHPLYGTTQLLT